MAIQLLCTDYFLALTLTEALMHADELTERLSLDYHVRTERRQAYTWNADYLLIRYPPALIVFGTLREHVKTSQAETAKAPTVRYTIYIGHTPRHERNPN